MIQDCIFCKIYNSKIPSYCLYKSDTMIAFLDINPLSENHFLIIPANHCEFMHECSENFLSEVLVVGRKILTTIYGEKCLPFYNVLQNNGKVAHQVNIF